MRDQCQRKREVQRGGFVLPAVVILIVFTVFMGMVILKVGVIEKASAGRRGTREATFYLAEGGIQHALAQLRLDENWQPEENGQPLGDGQFFVTREDVDNRILLSSKGVIGTNEQQIQLTLKFVHVWSEGIFAREGVYLGNNAKIASYDSSTDDFFPHGEEGHTGSLIKIDFSSNAVGIKGDAAVVAGGEEIDDNYVSGMIFNDAIFPETLTNMEEVVTPPELAELDYSTEEDLSRVDFDDADNFSLEDGYLDIRGNTQVELAPGSYRFKSIAVRGNAELLISDDTQFYVEEEVYLRGTPSWKMKGKTKLYLGQNSTFTASGDTTFYHIITGKEGDEELQSSDPTTFKIFSASNRDDAVELYNSPDKDGIVGFVGLIYAPHGGVDLANNTDFYGGITARGLVLGNNSNLYYDKNLSKADLDTYGGLEIFSWTKPDWTTGL